MWLLLILLFALALRTFHIAYPVWDYHNWRQTITLMVARDFARHDFPLLHPQVAWIGNHAADPSYFSAEFSIESVLAALLYKAFGEHEILARLVVVAFSLLGIACLYDLLNRRAGPAAARLGAFVYSLLPYHLFFGRAFMPDIPALALALAGLDLLDSWANDPRKTGRLLAAALFTALAVLQKLTVILVAFPMLYIFCLLYGRTLWKQRQPYIFACIAGVPAVGWYYVHAMILARQSVLSSLVMQRDSFAHHLDMWLHGAFVHQILAALSTEAFSPLGLALALVGLFWPAHGRALWIFRWWVVGAALVLISMPGVVANNLYYLSLLLPGGAALAGLALAALAQNRKARPAVAILLALFAAGAIYSAVPLYLPDRLPHDLGLSLNRLTETGDLLATEAGGSPNVLYAADRRGWLLEREYRLDRLEQLKQAGARYYADTFAADAREQRAFFQMLDSRYERLTAEDAPWQIYDLAPARVSTGKVQNSRLVNFGDRIQLRGVSARPLLDWPAVYEVVYSWHCIRPPARNLRVFVHVTDPAGQTVYQQDHRPRPALGSDIVERYVLTLPSALPEGKYQIRLGWFDPAQDARLPILNPGPADEHDRAVVADLAVGRGPTYGWFSPE